MTESSQPVPLTSEEPEWLGIARYKYLHDPEFHAFVEVITRERVAALTAEKERLERALFEIGALLCTPTQGKNSKCAPCLARRALGEADR